MNINKIIVRSLRFSKESILFTLIIGIVIFITSIVFTFILYSSHQENSQRQLSLAADRIDNTLTDIFEETRYLMGYIGKEIASHDEENLNFIANVLTNNSELISKNRGVLSWPMFDWINTKNLLVVNQTGISNNPINMSHRTYAIKCPQHPWTIQVSRPAIGIPSGLWEIPIGLGITNDKGKYLGTLVTGLEISKISSKVQQIFDSNQISFIILDEDLRIVLQSVDNSIDPKSSYYRDLLKKYSFFVLPKANLEEPIVYKNISYLFYKKIAHYPYVILTGFDNNVVSKDFILSVVPRLLELWGMGLFCIVLLYFFRKRILKDTYAAEKAKETFLQQVNQEMQNPVTSILTYSDIVLRYLKGTINVGISKERIIEFMNIIHEAASHLSFLTTPNLNLTFFDVNQVVKECINIHYHSILIRDIIIKSVLSEKLPPLYADELRFKQILLSLIALAIEYTPPGGTIKISTLLKSNKNKEFLSITVEDNGFGLNAEDIKRISNKFDTDKTSKKGSAIDLEFSSIEKLVKMHHGTCKLESIWPYGKKFTLVLPYKKDKEGEEKIPPDFPLASEKENNIFAFPKKIEEESKGA
ncbi:MAG: hypothetical protein BGO67_08105 [Alphaproteobacteria bacterium 41-28]|nr:MAG: hypothetical protein BGO67_08105 [Alphaproteobacteria bacterium 41-28]